MNTTLPSSRQRNAQQPADKESLCEAEVVVTIRRSAVKADPTGSLLLKRKRVATSYR
jgi:hypothetical protein